MLVAKECHVGMNLVGNDNDVVLEAEMSQSLQCFLWPAYASRVVWITQNQQSALVVDNLGQLLKVHLVGSIHLFQGVIDHLASITLGR